MKKTERYGEMFTFEKDARLWSDLYERPTKLFHHNMAIRRDYALEFAKRTLRPRARILDLGCGAGMLLEGLIDAGYTPVGVEPSDDMLALARDRLARFPEDRYSVVKGNCEAIPYEDQEFDAILCMGVFGYLDDVDGALKEVRRVLKPGGVFLMSIRNKTNTVMSDPWRVAKWTAGKMRRALARRNSGNQPFRIDIQDSPLNVIPGVKKMGFELESFDGFGFGPLSMFERQVLPLSLNIKLSDTLNRLFHALRLSSASAWLADVSMYAFRRV